MNKRFVDWEEYLDLLQNMAEEIKSSDAQVIIGLTRGGLFPAVFLSHASGKPMIAFEPHLLHTNGKERETIHLPISPPIIKNLLIVDDIADTGKTFSKCAKFFDSRGFTCTSMSVFINRIKTVFIPTYSGIESENRWIVFPYERE